MRAVVQGIGVLGVDGQALPPAARDSLAALQRQGANEQAAFGR